jgi:hypothetical protein
VSNASLLTRGSTAVMASRHEPPDSLDYFPTPPWATRALCKHVLANHLNITSDSAWDPACGEGHMSAVLAEFFAPVIATDIFDYSGADRAHWAPGWLRSQDFLDEKANTPVVDWIITNPPFKVAIDFALRAIDLAHVGVAMLVRTQWLESVGRYQRLFEPRPPTIFAPFVERVPMVKGCWDPTASTATSYAWFVWIRGEEYAPAITTKLIPPGCRNALTKPDDVKRFGKTVEAPLLA